MAITRHVRPKKAAAISPPVREKCCPGEREGAAFFSCGWGVILLLMKSEGSVKKKKKLNYRTIRQSTFANCSHRNHCACSPPSSYCRADFFRSCVCIPPGGELCSNFPQICWKFFFVFFFTCFYSRWRRWRRITRQMGETGGMTGNDGFVAMQWMNGTRHSPLSCRKHPKPTLRSSVCLCFDTLSTSCFMDNHAPNVMLKRTL